MVLMRREYPRDSLQHMAPEQLEAKEADGFPPLPAFGAIVDEMVTRRRSFHASSQASCLSRESSNRPPPPPLRPLTPSSLSVMIRSPLQRHFRMTRSNDDGVNGWRVDIAGGSRFKDCRDRQFAWLLASNERRPVAIS